MLDKSLTWRLIVLEQSLPQKVLQSDHMTNTIRFFCFVFNYIYFVLEGSQRTRITPEQTHPRFSVQNKLLAFRVWRVSLMYSSACWKHGDSQDFFPLLTRSLSAYFATPHLQKYVFMFNQGFVCCIEIVSVFQGIFWWKYSQTLYQR